MPHKSSVDYSPGSPYHLRRAHLMQYAQHCLRLLFTVYEEPKSLLDLGCGQGVHIAYCRHRNIEAVGVDLAVPMDEPGRNLMHADLRVPLDLGVTFDWVLCWEVAEHLQKESAEILCDTMARHLARPSGRLFFTAAHPGQRGDGHINCQPQDYWRDLLGRRGLQYQIAETEAVAALWKGDIKAAPWYGRNVQIFAWM